ncbi:MAG: gliding motility-associated C-terminal domain-containing protein [Bacteroidia bacterium]|nr:gliding motility-associated C-terminal domain-containing protein [Bacteroidia bacterium]
MKYIFLLTALIPWAGQAQPCDPAWFAYADTAFCRTRDTAHPIVLSTPNALWFTSPSGLAMLPGGAIDLQASQPGQYLILMVADDSCHHSYPQPVRIYDHENAAWHYPDTLFCTQNPDPSPIVAGDPGGSFWAGPGLALDSTTGTIDLSHSLPGQYEVHYLTPGHCPGDSAILTVVHSSPAAFLLSTAEYETICEGEAVQFIGGGGESYAFWIDGTVAQSKSALAQFVPDSLPLGHFPVALQVTDQNGCTAWDTLDFLVRNRPDILSLEYEHTTTEWARFSGTTDQPGAYIHWWADVAQTAALPTGSPDNDLSPAQATDGTFAFQKGFALTQAYSPADLTFKIQTEYQGCSGPVDTIVITLMPNVSDLFIPGVITPNGDGRNDIWEIRTNDNIQPDQYQITVYNRAGGQVYHQPTLTPGWSGSGLPDGVYWYVVTHTGKEIATGGVTIRR